MYESLQFITIMFCWGHVIDSTCSPTRADHFVVQPSYPPLSTLTTTTTTVNEDTLTSTGCQSVDLATDIAPMARIPFSRELAESVIISSYVVQPIFLVAIGYLGVANLAERGARYGGESLSGDMGLAGSPGITRWRATRASLSEYMVSAILG
jgi:hypothetical protein